MKTEIVYVELKKSGHNDSGPAWIGRARLSKTGRTVYFNNKGFKQAKGAFGYSHFDIETGDNYWISGVKRNQQDRHWAGRGGVMVDRAVLDEYLKIIGRSGLDPKYYALVDLDNSEGVVKRIEKINNEKLST